MKRLLGIQYLRAIAALGVVGFHAASRAGLNFRSGEAGVDLFFVLSGFLMVAITKADTRPADFLADRARRIVPLYWIATTVLLTAAAVGLFPNLQLQLWHVATSYLFIPSLSPSNGHFWPVLVPGWTLNDEVMFYVVFAATMVLRSQLRQIAAMTALFAGLVLTGLTLHPAGALGTVYTDPIMLEFALGGWIGLLWKSNWTWPRLIGWPSMAAAVLLFVAAGWDQDDRWRLLLFGLPAALLLLSVLGLERRQTTATWRLPLLLGDASYSIYLWHTLAISVAVRVCGLLHLPAAAVLPVGFAAGVTAGIGCFLLIEQPIIRFFQARRSARRAALQASFG